MFEFTHRRRIVSLFFGAVVVMAFASTGCVTHQHYSPEHSVYGVQAPPRSASHGYVHHYRDAVLVFDRSLNGYWVRSHPHHYFHSNHYYRWHSGRWHRARHIRGPWVSIELSAVPARLHHRGAVKHRRDDRRETVKERREDRRGAVKEKREDRREERRQVAKQVKRLRDDRREAVKEKREDRREVAKHRWDALQKAARERLEKRREIAESQKTRRVAKASAGVARGSVEHRRRKVRKDEDEELPANHGVE